MRWKQKTYSMYVSLLENHVIPYIGGIKLRDLNVNHINKLFAMLKDKPTHQNNPYRRSGTALSSTTRMHIFTVLGEALGYAVSARYIAQNPMPDARAKPKRAKVKNAIWTPDLFQMALEDMDNPMLRLGVHFAFMGSCREGEMLGITEDCIDLENRRIELSKTIARVSKESIKKAKKEEILFVFPDIEEGSNSSIVLATTKTEASERYAYLTEPLCGDIRMVMEQNRRNQEFYQDYAKYTLLFAQEKGAPVTVALMSKWFRKFIDRSGGKYPRIPFKNIRHSSATFKMILSHNDIKTVQGETGHASARVLMDTYAQTSDDLRIALMGKVADNFYGKKQPMPSLAKPAGPILDNPAMVELVQNLNPDQVYLLLQALAATPCAQSTDFAVVAN